MYIKFAVIFLALSLVMAGCAAKSNVPEFKTQYYSKCYDPINFLCKQRDNSELKSGLIWGAIAGLATGTVTYLLTGKMSQAAVAAGVAALAVGSVGYFTARISKNKERDARLAEYQKYLGENSQGWDVERTAVEAAYKCYREQIQELKTLAKGKRISREEFMARMNDIKAGVEHINTYWADAQTRMDTRLADGEKFLAEQEEADKKLAAGRQRAARAQLMAQRTNTQRQRAQKDKDVANINTLKNDTEADLKSLDTYFTTSEYFG